MTRKDSARRSLAPPRAVAAGRPGEHRLAASLEFITPMFGGGVRLRGEPQRHIKDPDPVTPVRGASLRGQLRSWWRRACCPGLDLDTMRARESVLWGWASTQKKPAKGLVAIAVDGRSLRRKDIAMYEHGAKGRLQPVGGYGNALAYAAFPLQPDKNAHGQPPGTVCRWLGRFTVTLTMGPERTRLADARKAWPQVDPDTLADHLWAEVKRAWLAFVTFGGLGGRTRRGFGAVRVVGAGAVSLSAALSTLGWDDRVATHKTPCTGRDAADLAHKNGLKKLRDFRQKPDLARDHGQGPKHPGRSRWPEPDAIRRAQNVRAGPHPPKHPVRDRFPRAAFGLPIIFHFIEKETGDATLQPQDAERLASPVLIRPVMDPDRTVHAVALRLPTRDDLSRVLGQLELRGTRYSTSGLLSAAEQDSVPPLRAWRARPASGLDAVYEPFFKFFSS